MGTRKLDGLKPSSLCKDVGAGISLLAKTQKGEPVFSPSRRIPRATGCPLCLTFSRTALRSRSRRTSCLVFRQSQTSTDLKLDGLKPSSFRARAGVEIFPRPFPAKERNKRERDQSGNRRSLPVRARKRARK